MEDAGVEDALSAEVFAPYVARALTGELAAVARPHPGGRSPPPPRPAARPPAARPPRLTAAADRRRRRHR